VDGDKRGWHLFTKPRQNMGQARQRREKLGALYGTPEGSNRKLIVFRGSDQPELDKKALIRIQEALAKGLPVLLIGTKAARPLATAAKLPWVHELPKGHSLPKAVAWDLEIAENGGPIVPLGYFDGGLTILGDGCAKWASKLHVFM
jgi:hypothetical protein